MLAFAAQIPSAELGTNYFQETHPEHLFKDCSDYCAVISEAGQLERVLPIAMRTAIAKRGVAVIVLRGNIATEHCSWSKRNLSAYWKTTQTSRPRVRRWKEPRRY